MEYFGTLKIDAAKRMIREGTHNFTEIAALLGYNSIHYFSRHFKRSYGHDAQRIRLQRQNSGHQKPYGIDTGFFAIVDVCANIRDSCGLA